MDASFWDQRYSRDDFVYGTEPDDFLVASAAAIPPGPVLCLAEGEGRNAVWLAARGHEVTAMDQSVVALAKAQRLAADRGVAIKTVVADLASYPIVSGAWSGIVSFWAHVPAALRRSLHTQVAQGLKPGGVFILEAYTPAQLAFDTGGPRNLDMLMTGTQLREELAGLEFQILRELERNVREGTKHIGRAAVVQVLARRPRPAAGSPRAGPAFDVEVMPAIFRILRSGQPSRFILARFCREFTHDPRRSPLKSAETERPTDLPGDFLPSLKTHASDRSHHLAFHDDVDHRTVDKGGEFQPVRTIQQYLMGPGIICRGTLGAGDNVDPGLFLVPQHIQAGKDNSGMSGLVAFIGADKHDLPGVKDHNVSPKLLCNFNSVGVSRTVPNGHG
jgi:SAM-dependent methyltransferase